jgi:hypothetical protein
MQVEMAFLPRMWDFVTRANQRDCGRQGRITLASPVFSPGISTAHVFIDEQNKKGDAVPHAVITKD